MLYRITDERYKKNTTYKNKYLLFKTDKNRNIYFIEFMLKKNVHFNIFIKYDDNNRITYIQCSNFTIFYFCYQDNNIYSIKDNINNKYFDFMINCKNNLHSIKSYKLNKCSNNSDISTNEYDRSMTDPDINAYSKHVLKCDIEKHVTDYEIVNEFLLLNEVEYFNSEQLDKKMNLIHELCVNNKVIDIYGRHRYVYKNSMNIPGIVKRKNTYQFIYFCSGKIHIYSNKNIQVLKHKCRNEAFIEVEFKCKDEHDIEVKVDSRIKVQEKEDCINYLFLFILLLIIIVLFCIIRYRKECKFD